MEETVVPRPQRREGGCFAKAGGRGSLQGRQVQGSGGGRRVEKLKTPGSGLLVRAVVTGREEPRGILFQVQLEATGGL